MNSKIVNLTARSVIIGLCVIGIILTIGVLLNNTAILNDPKTADAWLNPFITLTYVLIAISGFFTLLFPILGMIENPKSALAALGVVVGFGILFAIAYAFADGNTDAKYYADFNINSTWSRIIGASIYMAYLLGGLAVVALLGSGLLKNIKK